MTVHIYELAINLFSYFKFVGILALVFFYFIKTLCLLSTNIFRSIERANIVLT
jgi:hypothetical protein